MHKIKEIFMDELSEWEKKAEQMNGAPLSNTDLERIHKLTDAVKNIDKIEALEEDSGYSAASDWMSDSKIYGMSYANENGQGGYSSRRGRGPNAKRDSMGRYARRGNSSYGNNGSSYRGNYSNNYSYGDATEHLMNKAEEMLEVADSPEQKKAIESFMGKIEMMM